jgi:hypothetical protein
MLGFLGNLFAGWQRVPKHLNQEGHVIGWFRRSMGGYVILKEMTSTAGVLRARPYFWQALLSIIVIVVTAYVALVGTPSLPNNVKVHFPGEELIWPDEEPYAGSGPTEKAPETEQPQE